MAVKKGLGKGLDGIIKDKSASIQAPKESAVKGSAVMIGAAQKEI